MKEDNIDETILSDPRRVFNLDESAFYLHPTKKNVIAAKGTKNVFNINTGGAKQCLTVLFGGNAIGECPPALILHRYERVPRHISNNIPQSIVINNSPSGWMTAQTFLDYISGPFIDWIKEQNIQLPVALFVDGHSSHLTLPLCEFCNENGIILIALLPNSTHITQPMDVGIFFPLKSLWKKRRASWEIKNDGIIFQNFHFAPLLKEVIDELKLTATLFPNAFRTCGMYCGCEIVFFLFD